MIRPIGYKGMLLDGEGGSGGGGGTTDTVTLTKAEHDKLVKNAELKYSGGIKDGAERTMKKWTEYLSKKGYTVNGEEPEQILEPIFGGFETKMKEPNEQVTLLSEQLKVKDAELGKMKDYATQAQRDRDNHIIDSEILGTIGSHDIYDAKAAIQLLKQNSGYDIQRTNDGEIRVYKGKERYMVNGQYATIKDITEEFLQTNPWLVRSSQSQGSGKERTDVNFENIDITKMNPKQQEDLFQRFLKGELKGIGGN